MNPKKMNPMDTAPRDRPIRLHRPNGTSFMAYLVPVEGDSGIVWAWGEVVESTAPEDWCDGICWEVNSNYKKSTQPIGWS